ncbi:GspE/PulE family protein [Algisphaera agarilytica]|uniref:Type IV pilus assembly protein PilB n=1 Tax=Algisphaera agarilytica TaxID=1385975 RepID=A0A7X0H7J3_9BACT|nr:ATPase, T2SS/T4P/T4SS family [Algisphaera agarilytica]MBB6429250.1 type IV pilus assembly protein PilB [Algisphaera agarilytica]
MSTPPTPPSSETSRSPRNAAARARIGDLLLRDGAVTQEQLQEALGKQKSSGKLLGEVMVEAGLINSGQLVHTLAESLGVKGVQLRHGLMDPALLKVIGQDEAERLRVMPLFKVHGTMTVAMAEPQSLPTIDRLRQLTGCRVRPVLALEAEIRDFIKRYAGDDVDVDAFLTSLAETDVEVVEREQIDEDPDASLDRMVEGSPIVNLVNVAMLTAIKDGASDLHIEPDKKSTRIRYRVDGVLRDLMSPPPGMHSAIVSRVKVIGKMDIAEKRLPQEGRVRLVADGQDIDLRVSSMPTLLGEKLVVRVLDKRNLRVRMEDLGFRTEALESFKTMLHQPHGLVLVTGPTGSGKTTTLYSGLDLLRSPEHNIVTVEDPVEYQLDLINQIQVNEQVGLSFAKALRSILRQDPDVIMIGEIRDHETARVAVQAALTGHLVLATLHTNDAPGAVARLLDMGIEPYLLSGALNGVVAQRLARTVCPHCKTKYYPTEDALADAEIPDMSGKPFARGTGCAKCHNSGMLGRCGLYEVMEISPALRRFVHRGAASHEIREAWQKEGGRTLRQEGVEIAQRGDCSLEEILRVTHNDDLSEPEEGTDPPSAEQRRAAG